MKGMMIQRRPKEVQIGWYVVGKYPHSATHDVALFLFLILEGIKQKSGNTLTFSAIYMMCYNVLPRNANAKVYYYQE